MLTIIFPINISEFEYIDAFSYIVRRCCEASEIYYVGGYPSEMNHSKKTLEIAAIVIVVALTGVALAVPQQALANRPHNLFAIGTHGINAHGADGDKGVNGVNGVSVPGANGNNANGANGNNDNGMGANGISGGNANGVNGISAPGVNAASSNGVNGGNANGVNGTCTSAALPKSGFFN
jgi:hypothetical protein